MTRTRLAVTTQAKQHNKWVVLLSLCLTLLGGRAFALSPVPFVINSTSTDTIITRYSDYLLDRNNKLTFNDVRTLGDELPFKQATNNLERLGFSHDTWWVRFSLLNNSKQPLRLTLDLGPIQVAQLTLFRPDSKGNYNPSFAGSEFFPPWGDIRYREPLFKLELPPGEIQTYYLRILPKQSFTYSVQITDSTNLLNTLSFRDELLLLCIGVLFGLICLNLGFFWRQRDISYLFYACFLLFTALVCLTNTGLLGIEYFPLPGLQPRLEGFAISMAVAFTSLFTASFLGIRRQPGLSPWLTVILLFASLASALACWRLDATLGLQLAYAIILLSAIGFIVIGANCYLLGVRHSGLYLIAQTPVILSASLAMLAQYDVIPLDFSMNLPVLIATAIESLIFALGLSQKNFERLVRIMEQQHQQNLTTQEHRIRKQALTQLSHEIRTPLNGILGMTSLLADTSLSVVQKECVSSLEDASNHLLHTVSNVFQYAEDHVTPPKDEKQSFEIGSVVSRVSHLFQDKAKEQGIKLVDYIHANVPTRVIGNARLVQQSLANLLNVCLLHGQHGDLVFEVSLDPGASDTLQFRFEGNSLPTDNAWHSLLDRPLQDSFQDRVGINLALVQQAVQDMHGAFGRHGSNPWIKLELPADKSTPEERAANLQRLQGRTVLLVSNSQALVRILYRYALSWGMSATICTQPTEALSSLHLQLRMNEPYDIVIFDHHMADMDGLRLTQKIRQDTNLDKSMILIMLTNDPAFYQQFESGQQGIQRVLLEPVLGDQLQQVLIEELEVLQPLIAHRSGRPDHMQILVAEDHPLSQKVIRTMLSKLGAQTDIVANGRAAVQAVKNKSYDLVFMDCEMPEMDGFEATQKIRAWERSQGHPQIPIIALTAHVLHIHQERALASGMNAHVGKPVEIKMLRNVISRFLGKEEPTTHLQEGS